MTKHYKKTMCWGKYRFKDRSQFLPELGGSKSDSNLDSSASKISKLTEEDSTSEEETSESNDEPMYLFKSDFQNDSI